VANPLNAIATDNDDVDLTSPVTVFSATNGGSERVLVMLDVMVGDGTKDLDGTGATTLTMVVSNGGVAQQDIEVTVPDSQVRRRHQIDPIIWLPSETLSVTLESSNASDVDVDVTVTAYDVTPLQPEAGGAVAAIDSSGRVDIGSWLGTAVTTSATTGLPEVDAASISDDATAADNLELIAELDRGVMINATGGSTGKDADDLVDDIEEATDRWTVEITPGLKTTEGLNMQVTLRLLKNGTQVDPTTLDASCTGTLTIREHGDGASTLLVDESFTAADVVAGIIEDEISDPGFTADRLYHAKATIVANSVTYNGESVISCFG